MTGPATIRGARLSRWAEEVLSVLAGVGFTAALVVGMAHFSDTRPPPMPESFADLRILTAPLEVPPPPPTVEQVEQAAEADSPLAGLEVGASDSGVRIAVVPPDLEALVAPHQAMPRAVIEPGRFYAAAKPAAQRMLDVQHVYQSTEVDQKPMRLLTTVPQIPARVRNGASTLSVTLLIVVTEKGEATNVRVARSSGNPQFDAIIVRCVQEEWGFTPAVRKGKRVKCLTEQAYTVQWSASSPFHT